MLFLSIAFLKNVFKKPLLKSDLFFKKVEMKIKPWPQNSTMHPKENHGIRFKWYGDKNKKL